MVLRLGTGAKSDSTKKKALKSLWVDAEEDENSSGAEGDEVDEEGTSTAKGKKKEIDGDKFLKRFYLFACIHLLAFIMLVLSDL